MMPGGSASGWPVKHLRTLANLQDERLNLPSFHPNSTLVLPLKRGSEAC
jgi:hypothetical protein